MISRDILPEKDHLKLFFLHKTVYVSRANVIKLKSFYCQQIDLLTGLCVIIFSVWSIYGRTFWVSAGSINLGLVTI